MAIRSGIVKQHRHTSISSFFISSGGSGTTLDGRLMRTQHRSPRTFSLHSRKIWLVQSISIARIFATLLFAAFTSKGASVALLSCLYVFAIVSDVIDGYVSRKLKAETYVGKIMDLVADKALTIISMIYAASRGIDLLPIALIASRDVIMIGMRLVVVQGTQLFPTNRIFGGMMALLLWGNTLLLVWVKVDGGLLPVANAIYWACAIIFGANLLARLYASGPRIRAASMGDVLSEARTTGNGVECSGTCERSRPRSSQMQKIK